MSAGPDLEKGSGAPIELTELPPAPPTTVAVLESIATGAPERVVPQAAAAARVSDLFGLDAEHRDRVLRVFSKTRIDTRRMAIDPLDPDFDEFRRAPGTVRERMGLFRSHAAPLAVDVAARAVAGVPGGADSIGLLVFVTSTGFIAPGVDVAVLRELGLAPTVSRLVVNFMGCAAAMNGLRTASDYVRSHPGRKALVVCIELCSVNAVFAGDINDVIISSLFGDGCAAAVVGAAQVQQQLAPGRIVIRETFTHLLDDAEDGIVLGVNHNGVTCELSEQLPCYIYDGVDPALRTVLAQMDLQKSDIDLWAIHPGGPKIIEQSVRSLGIDADAARHSWDVLAGYGNMLSVSLLFVLESMQRHVARHGRAQAISTGVAFSFAPGVTVEGLVFDIIGH